MSKFLKVMIALVVIAAVAAPAFAEDRLAMGGEMRVRAWGTDDGTDKEAYMDQRLRMGGKFSIAEGVSVTFRTDVTEATWGNGGNSYGAGRIPADSKSMQWDRAYFDVAVGALNIRGGQQYAGFGLAQTINSEDTGLRFDYKGPVKVSAFWFLSNQNGAQADAYVSAVNVMHKTDSYAANVFLGNQTKEMDARESAYLFGADFTTKLNAINLAAEAGFFFGDAAEGVDAMGTQLMVDASMAASEQATVGAQVYYAMAADAGEVQYTYLGNDYNGWDPINDIGTNLSNEKHSYGRPFDFTGDGAGVIAGRLYGKFKASDAVKLGASVAYLMPEDDAVTFVDSAIALAASATYALAKNTSLEIQGQWLDADVEGADTDAVTFVGVGMFVNF